MLPLPVSTINTLVPLEEKARPVGDVTWDATENDLPVWVTVVEVSRSPIDPPGPLVYDTVMVSVGKSILSSESITLSPDVSTLVTATGAFVITPDMTKSEGSMEPFSVTFSESMRVIDLGVVATAETRTGGVTRILFVTGAASKLASDDAGALRVKALLRVYSCMPEPMVNILVPSVENARPVGNLSWDVTELVWGMIERSRGVVREYSCMPEPTTNILVPSVEKARSVGDASCDAADLV